MGRYAEETRVPADRSRDEIEKTLIRYGATGFGYQWEKREVAINPVPTHGPRTEQRMFAMIIFDFKDRRIRLALPMPTEREVGTVSKAEQATRQRWRALLLVIKAKLEAVESGISTLEQEFLAHVVTESGRTIGEIIIPRISEAVASGRLLPAKGSE